MKSIFGNISQIMYIISIVIHIMTPIISPFESVIKKKAYLINCSQQFTSCSLNAPPLTIEPQSCCHQILGMKLQRVLVDEQKTMQIDYFTLDL
jgi:hypothetical protein